MVREAARKTAVEKMATSEGKNRIKSHKTALPRKWREIDMIPQVAE
jgi:hypothetical protein